MTKTADRYGVRQLASELRDDLSLYGKGRIVRSLLTMLFDSRFQLPALYRLSRWMAGGRLSFLSLVLKWFQYLLMASEISPRAKLGRRVHFPHPTGVVIGDGVVIEDDVWVFQQVTIGSHGRSEDDAAYPVIGQGAKLYVGSKILGGIRVGARATVGANAVVLNDIPDDGVGVGIPARVVSK
jgi:serine O-acetyltransferase